MADTLRLADRYKQLSQSIPFLRFTARIGYFIMKPFVQTTSLPLPISTTSLKYAPRSPILKSVGEDQMRSMDDFMWEVKRLFEAPISPQNLMSMSMRLQEQFTEKLQSSDTCMLPSYNHTLPSGDEQGSYLAIDVGGSNLRVALVKLCGRQVNGGEMRIVKMFNYRIDESVRSLRGREFFDWMADRIEESISDPEIYKAHGPGTYAIGVAWSFPVEQTSIRTGLIMEMGKGFLASHGVIGEDLSELINQSCIKRNLDVRVDAIINDGSATLLSRAYSDSFTRFGLILGTGTNASIMLPVTAISDAKFANRPRIWREQAKHVLVNTEFSMFGKHILPMTRWDDYVNRTHNLPDYQPFEYLIGGRYLGEIVRLIIIEAVQTAGLFRNQIPERLLEAYSLETSLLAAIEADESTDLRVACNTFQQCHPLSSPPTPQDMQYVRQITQYVSHRATALLATAIHALWCLRASSENVSPASMGRITIGCNGSVIERYPQFRSLSQQYINQLTGMSGASPDHVVLEVAVESAIFGAAVAVGSLEGL